MKISREDKKALKQQMKQEKLERKEQMRQEKLQSKLQKRSKFEVEETEQNDTFENVIIEEETSIHNLDDVNSTFDTNEIVEENTDNISDEVTEKNAETLIDEAVEEKVETLNDEVTKKNTENATLEAETPKEDLTKVDIEPEQSELNQDEVKEVKEKVGFFKKIKNALKKTKDSISSKIDQIFGKGELNDEFFEDMEDILISSDLGVETSSDIIENMKAKIKKEKIKTVEEFKDILRDTIAEMLDFETEDEEFPKVSIIVGVNGVGKTTTIGKLANYYKSLGKKVVVVAGDTFRAAASDQLNEWAKRADVKIIKQSEGADSASVVFDGISFAKAKGFDVVLVDTAGRLHNKVNLMEELSKVNRVATKNWPEANFERFIVIDATTGQNAVNQVKEFNDAVELDGIILTKLDGSAKGGIVVSICNEYDIPVKFVGVGEGMDDLVPFDAHEFVEGII